MSDRHSDLGPRRHFTEADNDAFYAEYLKVIAAEKAWLDHIKASIRRRKRAAQRAAKNVAKP